VPTDAAYILEITKLLMLLPSNPTIPLSPPCFQRLSPTKNQFALTLELRAKLTTFE
jgi:hypothetical protein